MGLPPIWIEQNYRRKLAEQEREWEPAEEDEVQRLRDIIKLMVIVGGFIILVLVKIIYDLSLRWTP